MARAKLGVVDHYSIDLVNQDKNTYCIQISDLNQKAMLCELPLDAMDNTVAAVLDKDGIAQLGADVVNVFNALSVILQKQIGAKEFIVIPPGANLPDYIPGQDHKFKRMRQGNRADLEKGTSSILQQHPELVNELDQQYQFVLGMADIKNKLNQPYQTIFDFIKQNANFTPEKMAEYEKEGIPGIKARFDQSNVTAAAMLNNQNLVGILRCLAMGKQFGYLSDETLKQDILPLSKFSGETPIEKMKNRGQFLLAYFANKLLALDKNHNQFIIIAAEGREDIYDAIGFKLFPLNSKDAVLVMNLSKPGPVLNAIKEKLIKPFSNVEAISNLGICPVTHSPAMPVQDMQPSVHKVLK